MNDVFITALKVGALRFDLTPIYDLPRSHPYSGQVAVIPMICFHIALPGRAVLVDAMAYDFEQIPEAYRVAGYGPPPSLAAQMTHLGLDAREVGDVIITHAHFDHYGALSREVNGSDLPTFPNARHYLGTADWDPQAFDDFDQRTLGLVHEHDLLTLVDGPLDLGDGLKILPAPGETGGHQVLRLQHRRQVYLFVGDLYHHVLEFVDVEANVSWAEEITMAQSKRMLTAMAADEGALVYFSHIKGAYRAEEGELGEKYWVRHGEGAT